MYMERDRCTRFLEQKAGNNPSLFIGSWPDRLWHYWNNRKPCSGKQQANQDAETFRIHGYVENEQGAASSCPQGFVKTEKKRWLDVFLLMFRCMDSLYTYFLAQI